MQPTTASHARLDGAEDNEIPLGRRSRLYRAFEILPAVLSGSAIALVFVLPLFSPRLGACYVLFVVGIMFCRAVRGSVDLTRGYRRYKDSSCVDWSARLVDIGRIVYGGCVPARPTPSFQARRHRELLNEITTNPQDYPHPSDLVHAVIVAAYNESYEVIAPTMRALSSTSTPGEQMLILLAYEERGGEEMERTAHRLKEEFGRRFGAFELVQHPRDLPGELAGKGANITYAGHRLQEFTAARGLDPKNVLVTTLDCDNKPHESYFDCVAYEFIVCPERRKRSFQPISLYLNNIWDAPAVTRVIASANCFWNLTCTVRPFALRNFASHTQPLDALIEMNFWSKRTIVEDGHQFWRSYFHFRGDYRVVPIHVPIFQDAVLADGLKATMIAQFRQLSRWSYGASDVPFVVAGVFGRQRRSPLVKGTAHFLSLLEGHVTLACVSVIIALGGWVPFLIMWQDGGADGLVAHMPFVVGAVQQVAMLNLVVALIVFWNLLPPRPAHYGKWRSVMMFAQWLLFPATILVYNATTALWSQGRLMLGNYRENFHVTEKSASP